jgi:DNA-binding GntR family transcriptional regulator
MARSKLDIVYDELKSLIVSGELEPGDAIDKTALAERLGASRQPIAGAIDRLAYEGLVEVVPQHGSFVSRLEPAVIEDWFLVRSGMEAEFAARFAAAGNRPLGALERNLRYQRAALDAGDLMGFYDLDVEFHQIIVGFSPSPMGQSLLGQAQANLGRIRRLLLPEPDRPRQTLAEHDTIFDALKAGDADTAARAMRDHIATVARKLRGFIDTHPEILAQRMKERD